MLNIILDQSVSHKPHAGFISLRYIFAGMVLVILVAISITGTLLLRSAPQSTVPEEVATNSDDQAEEEITATATTNVAVTISYQRTPELKLIIDSINLTAALPNIDSFQPQNPTTYSTIRVTDNKNNALYEKTFAVPIAPAHICQEGGRATLVLPLPEGTTPAKVIILSRTDETLAGYQIEKLAQQQSNQEIQYLPRMATALSFTQANLGLSDRESVRQPGVQQYVGEKLRDVVITNVGGAEVSENEAQKIRLFSPRCSVAAQVTSDKHTLSFRVDHIVSSIKSRDPRARALCLLDGKNCEIVGGYMGMTINNAAHDIVPGEIYEAGFADGYKVRFVVKDESPAPAVYLAPDVH